MFTGFYLYSPFQEAIVIQPGQHLGVVGSFQSLNDKLSAVYTQIGTLSALIFEGLNFRGFRGCQIFEHFAGLKFREFRG